MTVGGEWRGLGGAPCRDHRHRAAGGLDRQLFQRLPQILRQRRAGVKGELHFAEKPAAQLLVVAQRRDQHVKAARHVEIHRRHYAAQVGERGCKQAGRGLAAVDIECAAIAQHQIEIVVGAEGMAPGQPVENNQIALRALQKRPGLRLGLLARRQHALGVDDRLRGSGRAGGEQEFCDGIRAERGEGLRDRIGFRGRCDVAKRNRGAAVGIAADDCCAMQRLDRRQRRHECLQVRDIDRAGIEQRDHAFQLVEILRHQRIGRRDRRHGYADMHRPKREQRVLDAVVGEDSQRALRAHALGQESRPPADRT